MMKNFNIRIEMLDNGYTVEVPDLDAIAEHEKAKEKAKNSNTPLMYMGDVVEKKVAKSAGEVLSIVKEALANLPENEYSDAFDEASEKEAE